MLSIITIESNLPAPKEFSTPEFTFRNAGPCLGFDQNLVERFEEGDPQYVCANLETNEASVYLELHIFEKDTNDQVYVAGGTFNSGPIAFYVNPHLPPGNYEVNITWARPALVEFDFQVREKE